MIETTSRAQTLLDALPDPALIVAPSGVIIASNSAWRGLLEEASSGAAPGSFDADFPWTRRLAAVFVGAPEDQDALAEGLRAVGAAERARFDFNYMYGRPGEERCLNITMSPIRARVGDEGEDGDVLIQARRATDPLLRRAAEAKLREVEERLERFMIATTQGVCLTDEGRVLDVNPAACRMLARTREELLGLNVADITPAEEQGEVMKRVRTNEPGAYESRLLRGDGAWFYAELSASRVPYQGRLIRGTAMHDITTRRAAELAVRESEERFRLLSDISSEAVVLTDGGVLIDVNAATCELLGYTKEELIGRPVLDVIDPEHHDAVRRAITTNRVEPYEIDAHHKDRTPIPVLVRGRVLPHRGRMIRGTTIRDLRLQRQMDEALREKLGREAELAAQAAALAELSTPLIPISDSTVVMPLIGAIDNQRAARVVEALLRGVGTSRASIAILDITGVPTVDSHIADALVRAARAVRLIGAEVVLTGIRPEVAQTLVAMGADLSDIPTRGSLQSGIAYAMERRRDQKRRAT